MNHFVKLATVCAAVLWWGLVPNAGAQDPDGYEILYGAKRGSLSDRSAAEMPALSAPRSAAAGGFDVLDYVLDIAIDPTAKTVAGTVDVRFAVVTAQLDSFLLYLKDNMIVTAVEMDAAPLPFTHVSDRIFIDLTAAYTWGDTLTLRVAYNGAPVQPLGLRFHSRVVYNLSEPDMARNWFPCYDEPWDKATSEMICTVPDDRFCASNGLLVSETDNLDGTKTYHWKTRYLHSTYLTSVAISDYATFSQWYHYSPTDSMEMPYYVYPEKLAAAQVSFVNARDMMAFFSDTFGEYPFVEEKYGTALAEVGGAMENLTCTTYGRALVDSTNRYDWVVAHEMAHSWFGNSVTLANWREVWLNEGFATYGDALWHEHTGGPAALESRMNQFRTKYFNEDADGRFPMYDPVIMWGATVYEKGAWVLHMLRYVVGDTTFFTGLRTYCQLHSYSTATTEELRTVFEAVSGMDLQWFFDQWVYGQGYPEYQYSWASSPDDDSYRLNLSVKQVQQNAPVFTMPIEILVTTTAGDSLLRLPVARAGESYHLVFPDPPVAVAFDPYNRILKTAAEFPTGIAEHRHAPALNVRAYPNPSRGEVRLLFFLNDDTGVVLDVYDVAGRHVGRVRKNGLASEWNSIALGRDADGVRLDHSGVYFYRLESGGRTATGKFTIVR